MKKVFALSAAAVLAAVLLFAGYHFSAAAQSPAPSGEILQAYREVLAGSRSYVQCNIYDGITGEAYLPGEIRQWYGFAFENPLRYNAFCIADMDGDGSPEIILRLNEDFGFELLRYENGLVYGFPFVYRAMEDITAGGDIHGSSGAEDYGWYRVRFLAGTMETQEICWKHVDENYSFHWTVDGKDVPEEAFVKRYDEISAQTRLAFTEYTQANLDAAMAANWRP